MRIDNLRSSDEESRLPSIQDLFQIAGRGVDAPRDSIPSSPVRPDLVASHHSDASSWNPGNSPDRASFQQVAPYPETQTRRSSLASYGSHAESTGSMASSYTEWSMAASERTERPHMSFDAQSESGLNTCGRRMASLALSESQHHGDFRSLPSQRRTPGVAKVEDKSPEAKKRQHSDNEKIRRKLQNIQIVLHAANIPKWVHAVTKVYGSKTNRGKPAKTVGLEESLIWRWTIELAVKELVGEGVVSEERLEELYHEKYKEVAERIGPMMDNLWDDSNLERLNEESESSGAEDGSRDHANAKASKKRTCNGLKRRTTARP